MSSPNYSRTATTIRPPLRILDAAGEPVLGLSHDATGLTIEWRRVGGPATWTVAPQTASGWTETGAGFYDATLVVGDQAGETVAVRWTHGGRTSLPGFVSFTGETGDAQAIKTRTDKMPIVGEQQTVTATDLGGANPRQYLLTVAVPE